MRIPYMGQLIRYSFSVLAVLVVAGPPNVAAQQANNANTANADTNPKAGQGLVDSLSFADRDDPIDIRSQSLEFLFEEKQVRYRDKVVATQGDVRLTCNLLTVIYEDQTDQAQQTRPQKTSAPATSNQRLKEIIAEGDVKVTAENGYATGKKLVFNNSKRTVVLSGDAILHEGANQVSGDRVIVYLDEKRSVVEGRARMQLVPQSKTQKGAASK